MLPAELNLRCIAGQVFYHKFSFVYEDGSPIPVMTQATRVRYVIRRYPWPSDPPGEPLFMADEGNPAELDIISLDDFLPNITVQVPSMTTELWQPGMYVHQLDYMYPSGTPPTPDWQEKVFRGAVSIFPAFMPVPVLVP